MTSCPRCGRENPPSAAACAVCGTPIAFGDEPIPARLDRELDLDRRSRTPVPAADLGEPDDPEGPGEPGPVELGPAPVHELEPEGSDWSLGAPLDDAGSGAAAEELRPAPPARRMAAWAIDGFLVAALGLALPVLLDASSGASLVLCELFVLVLALVYATTAHALGGATLGKRLARIRVVDLDGRPPAISVSAARAALALLSIAPAGAGLVPALLPPSHRAFHDLLAGTRVVEAP